MELPAYIAELDYWSAQTKSVESGVSPGSGDKPLPKEWRVRWQEQSFSVDTRWLQDGLEARRIPASSKETRENLVARLDALKQQALALQQRFTLPPGDARQRLTEILGRREFAAVHAPTWWDQLLLLIQEWWRKLMEKLFGGLRRGPDVGGILVWTAIGVLMSILALWLWRTWLRSGARIALDLREPLPPARDWQDWAHEAREAAVRGDHRQAIHSAYWAGIQRLDATGAWTVDSSRTPREYLRLFPPGHRHQAALSALTRRFEAVWYGYQPATATDFGEVVRHVENLGCQFPWTPAIARS
jgi:hypothetical protein